MVANNQICLNIPTAFSSSAQWIEWHKALIGCVGKIPANSLWIQLWDALGRSNTNAYTTTLSQYMQSQGIAVEESGGEVVARNLSDFGNWMGTGFKYARTIQFVLIGGVSLALLMLVYNLVMNPEKAQKSINAIGSTAMLGTPVGRVTKMIQ